MRAKQVVFFTIAAIFAALVIYSVPSVRAYLGNLDAIESGKGTVNFMGQDVLLKGTLTGDDHEILIINGSNSVAKNVTISTRGITSPDGQWICKTANCSSTCQANITGSLIVGCQ
jgi:hypothetical protein